VINALARWFNPAAPAIGEPDSGIAPRGVNDPLGVARAGAYQTESVHAKSDGYLPSWKLVLPPGFGDAPQHVWTTYALAPVSINGPGDVPASYFRTFVPPVWANFAMRFQGMPVEAGDLLMTGLYTPEPLAMPNPANWTGAAPIG